MQWNKATMAMTIPTNNPAHFTEPCSLSIIYTNRKVPIIPTTLPATSVLSTSGSFHYSAAYLTSCSDVHDQLQTEDLAAAFTKSAPFWFRIFLNTKQTAGHGLLKNFFTNPDCASKETVIEIQNRYLTYKISLLLSKPKRNSIQKNILLSTTVFFHNPIGRLYFAAIKPFYEYALLFSLKQMIAEVSDDNVQTVNEEREYLTPLFR